VERNIETKNRCTVSPHYISGLSFSLHCSCKLSASGRMWVVTYTAKRPTTLHLESSLKHCYQRTGLATGATNRKTNPYESKGVNCCSWNSLVLTNYVMNIHPAGSVAAVSCVQMWTQVRVLSCVLTFLIKSHIRKVATAKFHSEINTRAHTHTLSLFWRTGSSTAPWALRVL